MGTHIHRTVDLFVIICLWTTSLLAAENVLLRVVISTLSFFLFVSAIRLHSIANQCEIDSEHLYDYVFGLRKSRDNFAAQNSALAHLISIRKSSITKQRFNHQAVKQRRNSSAVDLRECVAARIKAQGMI
jgi:hypothetical protein